MDGQEYIPTKDHDHTDVPSKRKRSWWNDWGQTFEVDQCFDPIPVPPEQPIGPPPLDNSEVKFQPTIADFIIFETNKIDIYFLG